MTSETTDTLFAKIVRHELPAQIVLQDEDVTAFLDTHPAAPVHVLIVPNRTIRTLNDTDVADTRLVGKLIMTAQLLAHRLGIGESGYRVVINCNSDGGQTVYHLHVHLLGGRKLSWPPG